MRQTPKDGCAEHEQDTRRRTDLIGCEGAVGKLHVALRLGAYHCSATCPSSSRVE